MKDLHAWAIQWGIPIAAVRDLQLRMGTYSDTPPDVQAPLSEAGVQSRIRLEAAKKGLHLWRNNVGACTDEHGNHIRYGLANDSMKQNRIIKSADLVGIRPRLITPDMVGHLIGQFVSREVKPEGWQYKGTQHEKAQNNWAELILANGGDACFANGEGTL